MTKQKYILGGEVGCSSFNLKLVGLVQTDKNVGYIGQFKEFNIFHFYGACAIVPQNGSNLIEVDTENNSRFKHVVFLLEKNKIPIKER